MLELTAFLCCCTDLYFAFICILIILVAYTIVHTYNDNIISAWIQSSDCIGYYIASVSEIVCTSDDHTHILAVFHNIVVVILPTNIGRSLPLNSYATLSALCNTWIPDSSGWGCSEIRL